MKVFRLNRSDESSLDEQISAILNKVQAGDSAAESRLHQQFVERLVRLASSRINQRFRAKIEPEEIVQSVFASFFRRHREGEFSFEDWNDLWALLVKITIRKCASKIEGFMTAKRSVQREAQGKENAVDHSSLNVTSFEPTPEEVAVFQETLDQLFDRLSNQQQRIVCHRLQGMSNLEISEKIACSERTVYRSLTQIRELFLDLEE